jgi:hypothetical protein
VTARQPGYSIYGTLSPSRETSGTQPAYKHRPVDHADWNYRPLIFEIGYASGIFISALSAVATHLAGIDIHEKRREVQQILKQDGVFRICE